MCKFSSSLFIYNAVTLLQPNCHAMFVFLFVPYTCPPTLPSTFPDAVAFVRCGLFLEAFVKLSSQHAVPPSVHKLLCRGMLYAMCEVGEKT